jgi:hypothetical protein
LTHTSEAPDEHRNHHAPKRYVRADQATVAKKKGIEQMRGTKRAKVLASWVRDSE